MKDQDIVNIVESVLNGEKSYEFAFSILEGSREPLEDYKTSVARRLLLAWERYSSGVGTQGDFELALRDFALVYPGSRIKVDSYSLSPISQRLDISGSGAFGVSTLTCPKVNDKFLRNAFMLSEQEKRPTNPSFCLATSKFIRDLTGYKSFKSEEQKLVVTTALRCPEGFTELICMSTGGGKSLITQSVSYQNENSLTVVVVPTISLMIDQVRVAKDAIHPKDDAEIDYYCSNSSLSKLLNNIRSRKVRLLFVSPEAVLKNYELRDALEKAAETRYLQNIIVDEAHIVAEWGTLFRTDYQCLDAFQKGLLKRNSSLRTYLMSATFSETTVQQLRAAYSNGSNWIEVRCDKLRSEPRFSFIRAKDCFEKEALLDDLILKLPHPMIVYVQRPIQATQLVSHLHELGLNGVEEFTGKTSPSKREELIERWINDDFSIMVATCAFGVGVNKKDVRTVLHTYVPEGPNKYYQEAGRGGRDGLPSLSVVLYTEDDIHSAFQFTQKALTAEKLHGRWFSMLSNPGTICKADGTIEIDTSVKPKYSEDPELVDIANARDINWNVYAILLLRRAGLIDLLDVRYGGESAILNVRIKEPLLKDPKSAETKAIMEQIRTKEWGSVEREFQTMRVALNDSDKKCIGDIFTKVYGFTDKICSGCGSHSNAIDETNVNQIPLKKRIDNIPSSQEWVDQDALIITKSDAPSSLVAAAVKKGLAVAILKKEKYPIYEMGRKDTLFLYIDEWEKLFTVFPSAFNGVCAIDISGMNESEILRTLQYANYRRIDGTKYLFITDEDLYLAHRQRPLSEQYEGETIDGEIFLRRIANV